MVAHVPQSILANLPAEEAVIGACILDPDMVGECIELVQPDAFYRSEYKTIFEGMTVLYAEGSPVDAPALFEHLKKDGKLTESVSEAILHASERVASPVNAPYYAKKVAGKALARSVRTSCQKILQHAEHEGVTGAELLEYMETATFAIRRPSDTEGVQNAGVIVRSKLERMRNGTPKARGVDTGFTELDSMTEGLRPGQLVIVAGRPAMGKTSFAVCLAHNYLLQGMTVGFWSMEMSSDEVICSMLSSATGVELRSITKEARLQEGYEVLLDRAEVLLSQGFFISDTPAMTPAVLRAQARRLQRRHGLDLIVVDYIQLMQADGKHRSRHESVTEISRSLKVIARELGVPVVALCQLNRKVEDRMGDDPPCRPRMSDLRESGSLEQDADIVLLAYRESEYRTLAPRTKGEIIIAKNRSGPTGVTTLEFTPECVRWRNVPFSDTVS